MGKVYIYGQMGLNIMENMLYKWKDGRVFEGMFKNGKPNGKGKLTYKGIIILCEYKNGKQLTDIKKSLHQQMTGDI